MLWAWTRDAATTGYRAERAADAARCPPRRARATPARPKQHAAPPPTESMNASCRLIASQPSSPCLAQSWFPGNEEAAWRRCCDDLDLRREVPLGLAPSGPAGRRKPPGIGVVAQKDDHALQICGEPISCAQGLQHRLAGRIGLPGIADEIDARDDFLGPAAAGTGAEAAWAVPGTGERAGSARGAPIRSICGSPDGCGRSRSAFDLRVYSRPTANASSSQIPASTRFTRANPVVPNPSMVTPTKTSAADSTSPARQKKESMACLALYFSSRLVGRNRTLRTVF